jgi:serine/threonine-protein kinase
VRERQLPTAEAVRLAREVASGLDYAHRHGWCTATSRRRTSCCTRGHALITDFGVAKALTAAREPRGRRCGDATQAGARSARPRTWPRSRP